MVYGSFYVCGQCVNGKLLKYRICFWSFVWCMDLSMYVDNV
jgi:hypothetical protein